MWERYCGGRIKNEIIFLERDHWKLGCYPPEPLPTPLKRAGYERVKSQLASCQVAEQDHHRRTASLASPSESCKENECHIERTKLKFSLSYFIIFSTFKRSSHYQLKSIYIIQHHLLNSMCMFACISLRISYFVNSFSLLYFCNFTLWLLVFSDNVFQF